MHINTPKKIKLLYGINGMAVGGAERQLIEHLNLLDRDRFVISVVTLFELPGQPNLYGDIPSDVRVFRLNFSGFKDIFSWVRLVWVVCQVQPDIVVSSFFFSNTVFRILKLFFGYVSVAREHNTYTEQKKYHITVDRLLSPLSRTIVAVSSTVAEFKSKQAQISLDRFIVINNGVNLEKIHRELSALPTRDFLKKTTGFAEGDKIILSVSRLVPQKNTTLLIGGFALFCRKNPDYKLVIIGDGYLRPELESLVVHLGISSIVHFLGFKKNIWKYYKMSDFLASASLIEGMSNVYLEALSCGIPVVATRTAGTDDLITDGKNGFLIEKFELESVCATLERAVMSDRTQLSLEALESVKCFDIKVTVERYEKLFDEILCARK